MWMRAYFNGSGEAQEWRLWNWRFHIGLFFSTSLNQTVRVWYVRSVLRHTHTLPAEKRTFTTDLIVLSLTWDQLLVRALASSTPLLTLIWDQCRVFVYWGILSALLYSWWTADATITNSVVYFWGTKLHFTGSSGVELAVVNILVKSKFYFI